MQGNRICYEIRTALGELRAIVEQRRFSTALALLHNHRALAPEGPGPSPIDQLLTNTDMRLDAVPAAPARDSSVGLRDGARSRPSRGCDDS